MAVFLTILYYVFILIGVITICVGIEDFNDPHSKLPMAFGFTCVVVGTVLCLLAWAFLAGAAAIDRSSPKFRGTEIVHPVLT